MHQSFLDETSLHKTRPWDYLIITAANDQQARSYEFQLQRRERARLLESVRNCIVVSDIDGQRIGSGGSTLHCLLQILERECPGSGPVNFDEAEVVLSRLRILIVHAGGDSRRLPAYSHCGKMFVPVPGKGFDHAATLFDRLIPIFLCLPESRRGQVVVASGDALILFDASVLDLSRPGITAIASYVSSQEAAHHGVFCADKNGSVRRYLQKPSVDLQAMAGALNQAGEAALDLGIMSLDACAIVQLLQTFVTSRSQALGGSGLVWRTDVRAALLSHGIDLYREICCALGAEATLEHYEDSLRASGSKLPSAMLAEWFRSLHQIPLNLQILPQCKFLHFGTTRQLITSGIALLQEEAEKPVSDTLILNSKVHSKISADHAWIEGCSIGAPLTLEGFNTVIGVDVVEPLKLSSGNCLDLSPGKNRKGEDVWFLRYYDINDTFKHTAESGGSFCGVRLGEWLSTMGVDASDIWPSDTPEAERTLWSARVFPAEKEHQAFRNWLWMFHAEAATADQKRNFLAADRYSSSEIAVRVDQVQFHERRYAIRSGVPREHIQPRPSAIVG